jgi:hypothetical protein
MQLNRRCFPPLIFYGDFVIPNEAIPELAKVWRNEESEILRAQ